MPTYEYQCATCGNVIEVSQKITAEPLTLCEKCGNHTLKRGPGGGIGIAFTGSGFYSTDYVNRPSDSDAPPSTPSDSKKSSCCPCGKNKGSCASKDTE